MEFFRRAVPVIIAAFIAVSCASSEDETYEDKQQRSFEKWMELNAPQATKLESGVFYEWLDHAPDGAEKPRWGDYIEVDYRGLPINDHYIPATGQGDLFMTRYEQDAERVGTFTYYAHYVPQLMLYSRSNYLPEGMQIALEMMKVGDRVRVYMPSTMATVTSALTMTYGYGGNAQMPTTTPVIIEVALQGIVENPQTTEEKFVNEFAEREWGQNLGDTIREYVYLNILEETGKDVVTADSTAKIYYAAYLAYDDFLIETNIEERAEEFHRTISTASSTNKYVSFKPSSPPDSLTVASLDALAEVFKSEEITYGSKFEVITTSSYAYGASGQAVASGVTEVLPFQPIYLYVEVEEYEDD